MSRGADAKEAYLADFSLLLMTVVWGLSFTILKKVLGNQLSPIYFVFLRFTLASILIFPFCIGRMKRLGRDGILGGVLVGAFLFLGFAAQSVGIQYTSASKSAFMTSLAAIFVPMFLLMHKREFPGAVNGMAILAAMFGVYLLTDPAGSGWNKGDFLTLLCAAAFGAQIYILGIVVRRRDFLAITMVELITTMILSAAFLPFEEIRSQVTANSIAAVLFLGILGTAGTFLVQNWAQQRTSAVKAGLIFTAEPVFAYMFASAFLDDHFDPLQKTGGAIIVLAVIFSELIPLLRARIRRAVG